MNVNMNARYLFGIGMVLAVLMVFTATAAAENSSYFDPQHSNATIGNTTWVTLYVDIDEGTHFAGGQVELKFDPAHVDLIDCRKACPPAPTGAGQYCWEALDTNLDYTSNGYMWNPISGPQVSQWDDYYEVWTWETIYYIEGPATVPICRYRLEAVGTPGESPFNFGFEHFPEGCPLCQKTKFSDEMGVPFDTTWVNGTFTHLAGASETFTKSLPLGWNLISLPLTPTDNSVTSVLDGVAQDAVKQYNASSKLFEDATTMDPGIGYFVHVDLGGSTWTYEGWSETSTSSDLKSGLNMIGVPNCTMSVGDAMGSADYRYVARWNADDQKYEVYNPSAPAAFYGFTTMTAGEGYFVSATIEDGAFQINC